MFTEFYVEMAGVTCIVWCNYTWLKDCLVYFPKFCDFKERFIDNNKITRLTMLTWTFKPCLPTSTRKQRILKSEYRTQY